MSTRLERVGDLPWPGLWVERSWFQRDDTRFEILHVVSAHAGGEIRGYNRAEGDPRFALRHPAYPEDWSELDAAVAALVGVPCNGFFEVAS